MCSGPPTTASELLMITPDGVTGTMEGETLARKRKVMHWRDLIDVINTPMRYPEFPELTSAGGWRPWSAEPTSQQSTSSTVEQPKTEFSSMHRNETENKEQYDSPLQFEHLPDGHIRLLHLQQARFNNNILVGFKLVTVPLDSAPEYVALSYCWGSTDLCTGIFVSTPTHENQVYRVTENLAACLHSSLVTEQPDLQHLWVDQICINQENTDERNAQVRRMADIYKFASRVIVWLGQTSMPFEAEHDITLNADVHMDWHGDTLESWICKWAVFGRPWFYRQWVFQEAVFAQSISFLLGTVSLDFAALMGLRKSLQEFADENMAGRFFQDYDFYTNLNRQLVFWIDTTAHHSIRNSRDLVDLLCALGQQECRDPRDKIFSLMGMASNILPVDFVNYDHPAASVFQDLSRHFILGSRSLETLTYLDHRRPQQRPTWVVYWGNGVHDGIQLFLEESSASLGRKWRPSLPVIEDQLIVSGRIVDYIATEIQSFQASVSRYFESRFASVLRQPCYEAHLQSRRIHRIRHVGKSTKETVSSNKELVYTTEWISDSVAATLRESFSHFFRTVFLGKEEIESDFSNLIQESSDERSLTRLAELIEWVHRLGTLFVLKSGRLGFVHNLIRGPQVGDAIAILHGLEVPCILRKSEDGEGWLFISDIYIHDIMHGEDWDEDEADTFVLV